MADLAIPAISCWWITISDHDPAHGGHWDHVFATLDDPEARSDWGGPDWIRSPVSHARIRAMRKGDLLLAYQAGLGLCGMLTLASDGYQQVPGGKFDTFDLAATPVLRLAHPTPYAVLRDLPFAAQNFEFVRIKQGTVLGVTPAGLRDAVRLMLAYNPAQAGEIADFLRQCIV